MDITATNARGGGAGSRVSLRRLAFNHVVGSGVRTEEGKPRKALIATSLLGLTHAVLAVCDGVENALGVYFDQGTYEENCFEPVVGTPFSMYFVLRHGTLPDFRGIEFSWRFSPEPTSAAHLRLLVGSAGRISGTPTTSISGAARPADRANRLVVLSCQLPAMAAAAGPRRSSGSDRRPSPSHPGHAAVAGGDPLQIVPLNFCDDWDGADVTIDADGWTVPGVAAIAPAGGCGTVAVVGATWGSIKSLYR